MKAAIFNRVPYLGPARRDVWPAPGAGLAQRTSPRNQWTKVSNSFRSPTRSGFDWVTVAEHTDAPFLADPKSDGDGPAP